MGYLFDDIVEDIINQNSIISHIKKYEFSDDFNEDDESTVTMEIVEILEGDEKYIKDIFPLDLNEHEIDEDKTYRAKLLITTYENVSIPNIECTDLEPLN